MLNLLDPTSTGAKRTVVLASGIHPVFISGIHPVLTSGIHPGAPAGVGTGSCGRPLPLPQQLPRAIQVRALQTLTDSDTRCLRSIKSHEILNV
jgi:hypothetical protein